jgi:cytochrome d ubiquinol oxidase subunit I
MTTDYALEIPRGLSFLATHDPNARVAGLEEFPRDQWPNVRVVHWAFDVMVGSGMLMLALTLWADGLCLKHRLLPDNRWLLRGLVAAGPLGFLAIETGWVVTEVGHQPWIIYGVMRTSEAVTPMPGLVVPFVIFTAVYIFLALIVALLLRRQFLETGYPVPGQPSEAPHA